MKVKPAPRPRVALPVALVVAAVLAAPAAAHAYGVEGARLLRLSALIAWKDGHEVLVVSPVVTDVSGGGRLVVPLPPGGKIVPEPPGWPPGAGAAPAPGPDRDAGAKGDAARGPPPAGALRPGPHRPRGRAGGHAPVIALPRVTPPKVGFAEPVHVGFLPREKLRGVPRAVLGSYASRGWRFAVITLPEAAGPVRVGAVAFAFPARRPLMPLRLAEALPAHSLDLTVLAPGPIPDLGGMDFALGLARAPGGLVPPALARWTAKEVGLKVPVRSDFAAPAVNGPLRPLMRYDGDLTLPPPKAKAPPAAAPGTRPGASPAAPASAPEGTSAVASSRQTPKPPSSSGCGACAAAGGGSGGDAAVLVVGAMLLAALRRRRRRA